MADYETIRYALADNVATITLDRPETLNSLNRRLRTEIKHAVERAPAEGARAILITGEGRSFCSGQDLGETGGGLPDVSATLRDEYEPMLHAIVTAPLPVICAVNGVAAGAGASLALLGDIVIAAESASFVIAFARIGLVPDVAATYFLPRLIGLPRAMAMAMLTEPMEADKAVETGLIYRAVPDDMLIAEATALAVRMAAGPTKSFALMKKSLRASLDNDLAAQLELEARTQGEAAASRDFMEGVGAFLQKRPAKFEGR